MWPWLASLLCRHDWSNRWEREDGTPAPPHSEGSLRVWRCSKCPAVRRVQYLPIPKRPPHRLDGIDWMHKARTTAAESCAICGADPFKPCHALATLPLSDAAKRFIGADTSPNRLTDIVINRTASGSLGNWMHRRRINERAPCPICHSTRGEPCTDRDMRGLPVVTSEPPPMPPVRPPCEARLLYRGSASDLATDIVHALPPEKVAELIEELQRR